LGCPALSYYPRFELIKNSSEKTLTSQKTKKTLRSSYVWGFNGQEKVNEWAGIGNHNTAQFWEYDTRIARRSNLDPKPDPSVSLYAPFGLSPIRFADLLGDSIFVDKRGYITRNDQTDNMVFIMEEQTSKIGRSRESHKC